MEPTYRVLPIETRNIANFIQTVKTIPNVETNKGSFGVAILPIPIQTAQETMNRFFPTTGVQQAFRLFPRGVTHVVFKFYKTRLVMEKLRLDEKYEALGYLEEGERDSFILPIVLIDMETHGGVRKVCCDIQVYGGVDLCRYQLCGQRKRIMYASLDLMYRYCRRICEERDILFTDTKDENIVVSDQGIVRMIDFGIMYIGEGDDERRRRRFQMTVKKQIVPVEFLELVRTRTTPQRYQQIRRKYGQSQTLPARAQTEKDIALFSLYYAFVQIAHEMMKKCQDDLQFFEKTVMKPMLTRRTALDHLFPAQMMEAIQQHQQHYQQDFQQQDDQQYQQDFQQQQQPEPKQSKKRARPSQQK